jgi:Protein of unknown function DUF262
LPQPVAEAEDSEQLDDEPDEEDAGASREPRVRGRAPIFEPGQRAIASLMEDIERGVIALPDLQRPFVWEDTKVRSLLDSLFVGFPVGTLIFWHTSNDKDARALGAERPNLQATTLVIDGQQRLTSLCAVMRGVEVVGKDGATRQIKIAFRPRDGRFEVADAAIRNDPEFLENATVLWNGTHTKPQIRRDLVKALRTKDARSTKSTRTQWSAISTARMRSATTGFLRCTFERLRQPRMRKLRRRTLPRSSSVLTIRERASGKPTSY